MSKVPSESDLIYSSDVARRAARFFCWRRYRTKHGLLYLGSVVLLTGYIVFVYTQSGLDWQFGFLATLLVMSIILQATSFFSLPRLLVKSVSELNSQRGHIVLDDEGFTLSIDGNVIMFRWSRFKHVWAQAEFIVLNISYFSMLHLPTEGMVPDVRAEFERRGHSAVGA